jgi:hypothetical protein
MSRSDESSAAPNDVPFVLPKHLRFARSLALVSTAVVGIAAGAAVFGSGCSSCNGICGVYGVQPPVDAHLRPARDAGDGLDAAADATGQRVPPDGHAGGGPSPSPHLPPDWLV